MAEKNVKFYKTKDGTIVVCKDEVARQQIEQLQGIWEAIEELPDGQAVSAQVAIHTTEIAALQRGKANIDGSYDSMTVGMAKNVEATSEISGTSLYRPTAGNADVADGIARTLKIGGNATQWDQLIPNREEKTVNGYFSPIHNGDFPVVAQHKYYVVIYAKTSDTTYPTAAVAFGAPTAFISSYVALRDLQTTYQRYTYFITPQNSTNECRLKLASAYGASLTCKDCQVIDLTALCIDNLTTTDEVEAWLQANVGLQHYYAYNAGKLLATKLLGLRTVWLNQWDEQWEEGGLTQDMPNNRIRSKNYIPVIPSSTLYITTNANIAQYNADKELIGYGSNGSSSVPTYQSGEFVINSQAKYIKFNTGGTYGNTYNHDICINLHYTNGRDGEYEPYEEHQYNFDTSKVYGKLNGEGNYVQVFPDGMKSAGSVRDELTIKGGVAKIIKRVGSENLGTPTYTYDGRFLFQLTTAQMPVNNNSIANIITAKYTAVTYNQSTEKDKGISLSNPSKYITIKDSAYSDAATFKSAMNGVMLYYELAEPVEYTDLVYRDNGVDTPIDALNILVSNYGTEEQIVESPTNGEPNSCAATLDILYGVNAADFMDAANNGAFVSKASLDALCNTLGSALGGTLTSTWNSAEGHYDFTFTPATRQIENPENNE